MKNNKGIASILIFLIVAGVLVAGGIYYFWSQKSQKQLPTEEQGKNNFDFSKLNKDDLLHELFPNLFFKNGIADLLAEGFTSTDKIFLEDSIEDYFINNQEKSLLLIVRGSYYEGDLYLGLFDKNGSLLTTSYSFPKQNINNDNSYTFNSRKFSEKNSFTGSGKFYFYNCKGIKYILFVSTGCATGSCCDDSAVLFRINNGNFEVMQQSIAEGKIKPLSTILPVVNAAGGTSYGLKIIPSDDKVLIRKVPPTSENGCSEIDYKELKWNKNICRFE